MDADDLGNFEDLDSDGDGMLDMDEAMSDRDNDGIPDFIDAIDNTEEMEDNNDAEEMEESNIADTSREGIKDM